MNIDREYKFVLTTVTILFVYCSTSVAAQTPNLDGKLATTEADKARLIIFADMGWDPDEMQQMTHMLMCSNEFELEGLITVTGRFLRKNPPQKVKTLKPGKLVSDLRSDRKKQIYKI